MSWRDQLREASFRGAAFHVLSADSTFGRRVVPHEYPFRDLPYVEDMGRRARLMRIEAIVLGDNYMEARDALIAAAEEAGPGKLIHPYYGELTVSLDDSGVQIQETSEQGGVARISFSLIESGKASFPATTVATQDIVKTRADLATEAAVPGFADAFDVDKLPAFAVDSAFQHIDDALGVVESIVNTLPGISRGGVLSLIGLLRPELMDLLRTPLSLASRVQAVFSSLRTTLDPATGVRELARLQTFGASNVSLPVNTPVRVQENNNRLAIIELVQCSAAIERARASSELVFADTNTATTIRESVVQQIDQVADVTVNDVLFQALAGLRAAVVRDIAERGANLASLVQVTPTETTPSLVLAYELYDDARRESDIVSRNAVSHPGFLIGGQVLEVLSAA